MFDVPDMDAWDFTKKFRPHHNILIVVDMPLKRSWIGSKMIPSVLYVSVL